MFSFNLHDLTSQKGFSLEHVFSLLKGFALIRESDVVSIHRLLAYSPGQIVGVQIEQGLAFEKKIMIVTCSLTFLPPYSSTEHNFWNTQTDCCFKCDRISSYLKYIYIQ